MWGCFFKKYFSCAVGDVFPTHVGVFLHGKFHAFKI